MVVHRFPHRCDPARTRAATAPAGSGPAWSRTPPALRSSALDGLLRWRLGPRSRAAPSHAATPATAPRAARRERNPLTPSECFRTEGPALVVGHTFRRYMR